MSSSKPRWLTRESLLPLVLMGVLIAGAYLSLGYRLVAGPVVLDAEIHNYLVSAALVPGEKHGDPRLVDAGASFRVGPLFALLGSTVLAIFLPANADTFGALDILRGANVALTAFVVGLLFLFCYQFRGVVAGLVAVSLFVGDPITVALARRNLPGAAALLATLFVVLVLDRYPQGLTRSGVVLVGATCGLALLVDEGTFPILLLPLLQYGLAPSRAQRRFLSASVGCVLVALAIYAPYPIAAAYLAHWGDFVAGLATRLWPAGVIDLAAVTWTSGGAGLANTIVMLIGGGVFAWYLLLRARADYRARLLALWCIVGQLGLLVCVFAGRVDPQPWFLLLAPSAGVLGYITAMTIAAARQGGDRLSASVATFCLTLCAVLILSQVVTYSSTVLAGEDAPSRAVYAYLRSEVPSGTALLVVDDAAISLFQGYSVVVGPPSPEYMRAQGIHYAVLSSGSVPTFADRQADTDARRVIAGAVERYATAPAGLRVGVYFLAYADTAPVSPDTADPARSSALQLAARPIPPPGFGTDARYFPQTAHSVGGTFKALWEMGGVAIFGYPLTEPFPDNGRLVQYFERARFEGGTGANDGGSAVQIAMLGSEAIAARAGQGAFAPVAPASVGVGRRYFVATGHTLGGPFLAFWDRNGGERFFGAPISEESTEVNTTDGRPYVTQYFERARFEYRADPGPDPNGVSLGQLGREALLQRGWHP